MSYTIVRSQAGAALLADGWRVPAADVAQVREATTLVGELNRSTSAVEARAAAAEAQAREAGHAEGLEAGRRAGAAEVAGRLETLLREIAADRATVRAELGRLSLQVVQHIAAEMGPQAVLEGVAERAVREVLAEAPLKVRVAPAAAGGVSARLHAYADAVEVVPDLTVGEGECVVASRQGATHAGLHVQLSALERAFAGGGT